MECRFVVGQRVCCVRRGIFGDWRDWLGNPLEGGAPAVGDVCEVVGFLEFLGVIYIRIAGYPESSYGASNFRPLVEPSIEVFERLLEKLPARGGVFSHELSG